MMDLTGDGVKELIVYELFSTTVFGCVGGKHRIMLDYIDFDDSLTISPAYIYAIQDLNRNGTPDIVFAYPKTTGWDTTVNILEWNGKDFVSLIQADHGENSIKTSRLANTLYWYEREWISGWFSSSNIPSMNGGADIEIRDIDGNSTQELILTDSGPAHPDMLYSFGPWRGKRVVFSWDGIHYLYSDLQMGPPEYRFQALQDADRLFLLGEYDAALALYQDVIFSDQLEWWTRERMDFIRDTVWGKENIIEPKPNPDEYLHLAAYARYRILLHHISRGWFEEAEIVHKTLQEKFPEGSVGYEYAEMATFLWNEYHQSRNLESACDQIVEYVSSNTELLGFLETSSLQSHIYVPEDLCPFP